MHLVCPQCSKKIRINIEQLPADKEKAGVKCPQCAKVVVFRIPSRAKTNSEATMVSSEVQFDIVNLGDNPKVVVVNGPNQGKIIELKDGINTVGRANSRSMPDIAIVGDPIVSRTHCFIEVMKTKSGPKAVVFDCNSQGESCSTNGTFIKGKERKLSKFDRVYLAVGDQIDVGETKLELC